MEKKYKGFTINIENDEYPENPRTWADQTIIYSNHRDYDPDNHKLSELMAEYEVNDVQSLTEKLTAENVKFVKVYAYIHSGIALSIGAPSVNDKFDTGLFGIMTLDMVNVDESVIENPAIVQSIFEDDIEQLNHYYNGEVYSMEITDDEGDDVSSCGGFLSEEDALQSAKDEIDGIIKQNKNLLNSAEIPTSHLKNVFYKYATQAPCWADDVMDLVAETKIRKWLRNQIKEMLSEAEIRSEFSQFA